MKIKAYCVSHATFCAGNLLCVKPLLFQPAILGPVTAVTFAVCVTPFLHVQSILHAVSFYILLEDSPVSGRLASPATAFLRFGADVGVYIVEWVPILAMCLERFRIPSSGRCILCRYEHEASIEVGRRNALPPEQCSTSCLKLASRQETTRNPNRMSVLRAGSPLNHETLPGDSIKSGTTGRVLDEVLLPHPIPRLEAISGCGT